MSTPEVATGAEIFKPGTGQDPARYLVDPGHWNAGTKRMTPGQLAHARPWLDSGVRIFIWPTPTEGFRRQGSNMLALHHYIGDENVDVQILHRGEKRIEMSGVFAGTTAADSMANFENALTDDPPDGGMVLNVPGAFEQVKFVVPENWDLTHDADDQTSSLSYTVTFVVMGEGKRVPDPGGGAPPANPSSGPIGSGSGGGSQSTPSTPSNPGTPNPPIVPTPQPTYIPGTPNPITGLFTTSGMRTLRAISNFVYGTPDNWDIIYNLNRSFIDDYQTPRIPASQIPTFLFAVGIHFVV